MKARRVAVAIAAVLGGARVGISAPTLTYIQSTSANAPNLFQWTFQIMDPEGPAIYAIEIGWEGAGGSYIKQTLLPTEDDINNVPLPANRRSQWFTTAQRNNDSWVFDANFPTTFGGQNPFGGGDFNGSDPGDFTEYSEGLKANSYAIAVSSAGPLASGSSVAQIVTNGGVSFTGFITRNGVRGDRISGVAGSGIHGTSLTSGGHPAVTVPGGGTSYVATRVATYGPGTSVGTAEFDLAGANRGGVILALDLTLNGTDLDTALGNLGNLAQFGPVSPSYLAYFNAQPGLGGSFDVVLGYTGVDSRSGPFPLFF